MQTTIIDNPLKVSPLAAKPTVADTPRDDRKFEKHLREAVVETPPPSKPRTKEKPPAEPPLREKPVVTGDQDKSGAAKSESAPVEELEGKHEPMASSNDELVTVEPDEVIVSVVATTFEEAAPITVSAEVEELVVTATVTLNAPESPRQDPTKGTETASPKMSFEIGTDIIGLSDHKPVNAEGEEKSPVIHPNDTKIEGEVVEAIAIEPIIEETSPPTKATTSNSVEVQTEAARTVTVPTVETAQVAELKSSQLKASSTKTRQDESEETAEEAAKPATVERPAKNTQPVSAELIVERLETEKLETTTRHEAEPAAAVQSREPIGPAPGAHQKQEPTMQQSEPRAISQPEGDSQTPTVDRARFVQRVANAFRSAHQNDGHIQLRLSPPELGSLKIEIAVRHGVLTANLETETADARRILLDNLPSLRQRLAEQEIRIEKFEVDIRRDGGQQGGQAGAEDRQAQQQSQRAAQNRIRSPQTADVQTARVPRSVAMVADANLDVRI